MDNRKLIQKGINYIEDNLKAEITVQELAEMAGFSVYHYYRIFQSATGMPVVQYILRRRLLNAIYEIGQGKGITDVAFMYGFDTFAGFYKAFKREIGYTPSDFLNKYKAKKPYKINLFVEEHIMITHKKLKEVLKNWGLENEEIKDIYYENTGNRNDNAFYVGNDYVIKFSANLGKLKNHIELSSALMDAGLFAAAPIKTLSGEDCIQDGELYFCLAKRLEGSQLTTKSLYESDAASARFVGEIIGQLHMALKELTTVADEANLYETVVNWALPKAIELLPLADDFCKNYITILNDSYKKLPVQIIHRDPNPGNIIMKDNKWGFLDFELSERNIRIFDPCYAATAILSESFAEDDTQKLSKWITLYKNIIYGYDSVVKLSPEEKTIIPYIILANQFICVAWLSEQPKYEDIYNTNLKMTTWLVENFEALQL